VCSTEWVQPSVKLVVASAVMVPAVARQSIRIPPPLAVGGGRATNAGQLT
jgi:hypothetical protein